MSAREYPYGRAGIAEIDCNDGIDRLAVDGVILAYADPAVTVWINPAVGEAPLPLARGWPRRERLRFESTWHLPIQAAVREIGEIDSPVTHRPRSAAIFVDAAACIEGRWGDVGGAIGGGAHDDISTLFLRTSFQPIDFFTIKAHFGQGNGLRDDEVGCDR